MKIFLGIVLVLNMASMISAYYSNNLNGIIMSGICAIITTILNRDY